MIPSCTNETDGHPFRHAPLGHLITLTVAGACGPSAASVSAATSRSDKPFRRTLSTQDYSGTQPADAYYSTHSEWGEAATHVAVSTGCPRDESPCSVH